MSQDLTHRIKQLETLVFELKAAVEELKKTKVSTQQEVPRPTITLKKT